MAHPADRRFVALWRSGAVTVIHTAPGWRPHKYRARPGVRTWAVLKLYLLLTAAGWERHPLCYASGGVVFYEPAPVAVALPVRQEALSQA